MKPMTLKEFDKLSRRDFENGAVIEEIREALKERERLLKYRKANYWDWGGDNFSNIRVNIGE